jgi:hypothetical protein
MTKILTFGLPNGKSCSVAKYAAAWATLKTLAPTALCPGFEHFPEPASRILAAMRSGMHDRINRHIPGFGKGRKWSSDWYWPMYRAARDLNAPRLIVRWVPAELMRRPSIKARIESYREY